MPRSSNPGTLVLAAMYVVTGAFFTLMGAVFSTGGGWGLLIGVPLLLGGVSSIVGAVQMVVRWRQAVRDEAATVDAVREKLVSDSVYDTHLAWAHWTYDGEEWAAYTRRERNFRLLQGIGLALLFLAVGALLIGTGAGAIGVVIGIGALILAKYWVRAFMAWRSNRAAAIPEVVINASSILFNGRYQVLQDHQYSFGGARYLEREKPPILELAVKWKTSRGVTDERYRIPVPRDRELEARGLVSRFSSYHGVPERA
jgi:hypothetical protein